MMPFAIIPSFGPCCCCDMADCDESEGGACADGVDIDGGGSDGGGDCCGDARGCCCGC